MAKPLAGVPGFRWLGNSDIIRQIQAADPNTPQPAFSLMPPNDWTTGHNGKPVARYRSLAAFQADVTDRGIGPFGWVLYDPENWDDTPPEEQADPWTWLPRFGQYAHAHGYRVISAPARDLGNVANSVQPKKPGDSLDNWYVRTGIAFQAALHADIVSLQSQADTEDVTAFNAFVWSGVQHAKRANPYVKVFAGVSTRYGTAAQMAAAALAVHVDGYWLNVPGPSPDVGKAVEFLHLMTGGA